MIAIIGGSIAAFVAYSTIKKIDPDADVKVFSKEKTMPYSKMLLPYMLTSNVEDNMFYSIGDDLLLSKEIIELNYKKKYIKDTSGWKYYFDKAIIATGADAKLQSFNGNYSKDKIITIRYIDDIYKVRKFLRSAKLRKVVIIGAGLVSMEMGYALSMAGFKLDFVVGSNRILSQILDKDSANFVEKLIKERFNVKFHKQNGVDFVEDSGNGVVVKLKTGESIECDFVVVGRGVKPNTSFLNKNENEDGIEVNSFLETEMKGIYAVGDVAKSYDSILDSKVVHAIWPVAVEQAEIAAKNVLGLKIEENPQVSRNVLPVFGMNIFTGGLSKIDSYDGILWDKSDGIRKILFKDGHLDGFVFICQDFQNFGEYISIMRNRLDIKGKEAGLLFSPKLT